MTSQPMSKLALLFCLISVISIGCRESTTEPQSTKKQVQSLGVSKIWSDQFPDVVANYLPGGAGTDCCGGPVNFIMMGARPDGKAYMKAEVVFPADPSDQENTIIRLAIVRHDEILPVPVDDGTAVSVDGNVVSLSTVLDCESDPLLDCAEPYEYYVVAGIDENENNELDPEEIVAESPGLFRVISQDLYDDTFLYLDSGRRFLDVFPGDPLPFAVEFARAFLENDVLQLDDVVDRSPINIGDIENFPPSGSLSLEHHVGVIFTDYYSGPVKDFYFPSHSEIAEAIRSSNTFERVIGYTVESNSAGVQDAGSFEWPLRQPPEDMESGQAVNEVLFGHPDDLDLFLTFGKVVVSGSLEATVDCINGRLELTNLEVTGSVYDLYDYDYGSRANLARKMLFIQTGYGTLGDGGNVFRTEVSLDADIPAYSYDFGSCSSDYCSQFPPPPGETHTFQVVGTSYTFTTISERVSERVGGYVVYRTRRSDNPPGLGMYTGCDPNHGEVDVATDWWNLINPDQRGRYYWEPPLYTCQYGDPAGTVCEWVGEFAGGYQREVTEVIGYESVTVPYGTFQNVMKIENTVYDEDGIFDGPLYFWIDSQIGPVRAEEVGSGSAIELIAYSPPAYDAKTLAFPRRLRVTHRCLLRDCFNTRMTTVQ